MKNIIEMISEVESYKLTPELEKDIELAIDAALDYEGFPIQAEISVTLVSVEEIRRLNHEFRDLDTSTDVLSFPMLDDIGEIDVCSKEPEMLGDIILCPEIIASQAGDFGNDYKSELIYMIIHSVLHLLGYDHVNSAEEEKEMFFKQDKIFESLKTKLEG